MKRILLICLAALWLVPSVAMAHSKLENAVPAQDATVTVSPESIQLTFNTKIEKLSNFKVLNAAGEQIETGKAVVENQSMSEEVPAVLANGIYTVKWTIIGADGHSVEGDYAFTVNAPVASAEPTVEPEPSAVAPEASQKPSPEATTNADTASSGENNSAAAMDKAGTNYTPIIIIGVIIVAAAIVLSVRRRKK